MTLCYSIANKLARDLLLYDLAYKVFPLIPLKLMASLAPLKISKSMSLTHLLYKQYRRLNFYMLRHLLSRLHEHGRHDERKGVEEPLEAGVAVKLGLAPPWADAED